MTFEMETATYEANKDRLLAEHYGEHVLIRGSEIVGVFPDHGAALKAGYLRFGYVDLFTKKIQRRERPLTLAAIPPRPSARKVQAHR